MPALQRLVAASRAAEKQQARGIAGSPRRWRAIFFKLMAYKDEYEVARLYTDGTFQKALARQFEGDFTLEFHLAPPLLAERDPVTGQLQKRGYGPWMLHAFAVLARLKGLRGTPFDLFGRSAERRMERQLIADYEAFSRSSSPRSPPRTTRSPSRSRACPSRSAATATSRRATSPTPRRARRRRSSPPSARRCRKPPPRNSAFHIPSSTSPNSTQPSPSKRTSCIWLIGKKLVGLVLT